MGGFDGFCGKRWMERVGARRGGCGDRGEPLWVMLGQARLALGLTGFSASTQNMMPVCCRVVLFT
jgi:hypothetical protein